MKKKVLILLFILGGIIMAFSINGQMQKAAEEKRNREYEVSLVKALKNSYRDIQEIELSSPDYSVPPGNWSCVVKLTFAHGRVVQDRVNHSLSVKRNRSVDIGIDDADIISSYYGMTEDKVKIIYSTGEEEIQ
ncbi:hypothetical protein [Streptococcus cuniculi]|uniref:DUF1310 family protein n=1 Tax=Streptococcus cuniculi TaxID=1432788 RepID=A0A4Y9JDF4_9STRE|nr:hypothetical protein [Streptococcus cuniculi]MBF0778252.1 hypothetical protein [Streptococcus cuniculi]TFU97989.1 hypothetical protein E4T82_05880 [Streptococcus cuniculi]